MSCWKFRVGIAAVLMVTSFAEASPGDKPKKPAPSELSMTPAVACRLIDGYEQFEPLPDAAITSDEKLKVYYRPVDYAIEKKGKEYIARFTQDGAIRRKGEKKVLWKKDNLLEYEAKNESPPYQVYLTNLVGLKGLPPGEYELTITLHDALREGSSATQTLPFRIIPTPAVPTTQEATKTTDDTSAVTRPKSPR